MTPEIEQLIHDVLHGDAGPEDRQRLSGWITADEANAKAYLRIAMDERAIRISLDRQASQSLEALSQSPEDSNAGEVLAELVRLEEQAEKLDPMALATERFQTTSSQTPNKPQYLSALSYVIEHTFTPKRVAILATAAVLLLGVVLIVVLMTGSSDDEQMIVKTPEPAIVSVSPIVATLTGERDAVWDRRPGEDLYAGQRFTLIDGFAEITTHRGAVAILEAPATFQLLDDKNALRLHEGRLVGRCDIESSRGFVVHTSNARIVDIGTEFGVTVHRDRVETVVFNGEVTVQPALRHQAPQTTPTVRLLRGQYAAVDQSGALTSGEIADSGVGLSYLRSLEPRDVASRRYAQAVLKSEPLIYWGMQNWAAGSVVNSGIAGNRYEGRTEAPEHKEGGIGGSYARFGDAGPDSMITMDGPIRELEGSDSYTIECWVRVSDYHRGMIAGLSVDGELSVMHLEVIDDVLASDLGGVARTIRLVHRDTPSILGGQQLYSEPYRLDTWMHLVCVKNGDRLALFIDGEMAARGASDRPIAGAPRLLVGLMNAELGIQEDDARIFHGDMDEFALYRQPLDAQVIKRHYALGTNALLDHDPVPLSD